jgi:hypothetical protein
MGANIKMDLNEIEWVAVGKIHLAPRILTGSRFFKLFLSMTR